MKRRIKAISTIYRSELIEKELDRIFGEEGWEGVLAINSSFSNVDIVIGGAYFSSTHTARWIFSRSSVKYGLFRTYIKPKDKRIAPTNFIVGLYGYPIYFNNTQIRKHKGGTKAVGELIGQHRLDFGLEKKIDCIRSKATTEEGVELMVVMELAEGENMWKVRLEE